MTYFLPLSTPIKRGQKELKNISFLTQIFGETKIVTHFSKNLKIFKNFRKILKMRRFSKILKILRNFQKNFLQNFKNLKNDLSLGFGLNLGLKRMVPYCPWNFQSRPVLIDRSYGISYMEFSPFFLPILCVEKIEVKFSNFHLINSP